MPAARNSRGRKRETRNVIAEIDARMAELDAELEAVKPLMAERRRLVQARATLTGQRGSPAGSLVRKVTQDEIAEYLAKHPGSRAGPIGKELGVPLTNISQHLHRGKDTRFERREDGWHLRKPKRP